MTLIELATAAAKEIRQGDYSTALEQAKGYVRTRYRLIWDRFLWKDTVILKDATVLQETVDGTDRYQNELVLPYEIDRPCLIYRLSDARILDLAQLTSLARVASNSGNVGWYELSRVAIPMAVSEYTNWQLLATGDGAEVTVRYSDDSERELYSLTNAASYLIWDNQGQQPISITKSEESPAVTLRVWEDPDTTDIVSCIWPRGDTNLSFARVELIDRPDTSDQAELRIIGKRKINPLVDDTDSPIIRGCSDALLALVMGDMHRWDNEYAIAQQFQDEGLALVRQLMDLELNQSADLRQIVPADVLTTSADEFGW